MKGKALAGTGATGLALLGPVKPCATLRTVGLALLGPTERGKKEKKKERVSDGHKVCLHTFSRTVGLALLGRQGRGERKPDPTAQITDH